MIRGIVAGVIVAALLLTVAGRLFYLQVIKHNYYAELSQGNRVHTDPIPPSRGLILDRHGVVLADNLPAFQLELVREQVGGMPELDAALARLVAIGLLDADELRGLKRTILSHHVYESVPLKLALDDEEMARFAVHRYEFTGVDIRTRLSRHYPFGAMAVHALGYVAAISEQDLTRIDSATYAGTTLIGKLGVEGAYENQLHGTPGYREVLVNAAGRPVERQGAYTPKLNTRQPIAGSDLILSLDMRVQRAAEEALVGQAGSGDRDRSAHRRCHCPRQHPRIRSQCVCPRPDDQAIRCSAKRHRQAADQPGAARRLPAGLHRQAVLRVGGAEIRRHDSGADHILPRTFQPARLGPSVPGLEAEGPRHDFDAPRHPAILRRVFLHGGEQARHRSDARFHGHLRIRRPHRHRYSGRKARIDALDRMEAARLQKAPPSRCGIAGETISVGIGQGYMLATPMQLAHAVSGIASRGQIFKPRLVTAVRAPGSNTLNPRPVQQEPSLTAVTADQWSVIVDGMELATGPGGTAAAATAGSPYKIAGKTGSAQVFTIGQNEKYNEKQLSERMLDHALFISFAPAEDPKLAVAVFVENGKHGGSTAAPIARKMFDAYLLPEKAGSLEKP